MTIGELAAKAGLRPSAIRYYESAGILPLPVRASGRRVYREDALARLAVLQFAQAGSFSIREIRELFAGSAGERAVSMRWRRLASAKLVELDALVVRVASMKRLLQQALRCGCVDVEECGRAIQRRAGRTTSPVRR